MHPVVFWHIRRRPRRRFLRNRLITAKRFRLQLHYAVINDNNDVIISHSTTFTRCSSRQKRHGLLLLTRLRRGYMHSWTRRHLFSSLQLSALENPHGHPVLLCSQTR